MRRRTFLQSILFLPFVRTTAAQTAPMAGELVYRDSVGGDGALLAAVLRDHSITTGVRYAGN